MNYTDIHTFLTIVSSSSLSKAAEVLFVSQPALSHRLSALEEELGTEATVVATGGLAKKIIPYCKKKIMLDEELLLKGLLIIYEKNNK